MHSNLSRSLRCGTALLAMAVASAFAQSQGTPLTPEADIRLQEQMKAILEEKASRTPEMRKMSQDLVLTLRKSRGDQILKSLPKLQIPALAQPDGTVDVEFVANIDGFLLQNLRILGAQIQTVYPAYRSLNARIPISSLVAMARTPGVTFIRTPDKWAKSTGSAQSEGYFSLRTDFMRSYLGLEGIGVKVGVISDSNDYMENSIATQDIRSVHVLSGRDGRPGTGEGTAMMEIVHDLAPRSDLIFSTCGPSQASFAQNFRDLFAAGCSVLTDDIFFFAEPAFQDGPIAKAVNDIYRGGGIVFSAAGNEGNQLYRNNPQLDYSAVWEGDFADSNRSVTAAGKTGQIHTFGPSVRNRIKDPGLGYLTLQWNDRYDSPTSDYDLYVTDGSGNVVAYSADENTVAGGRAYEQVYVGPNTIYSAMVAKISGADRVIRVNQLRGWMDYTTPGQIWGHAAAEHGIGTGTINSRRMPIVATEQPTYYSSDGPRRVYYDENGVQISPDLTYAGGLIRQQPTLTAVDGVSTTVPNFVPFYGTSAAAPHAAAITALLRELAPDATPNELRNALTGGAVDLLTPGWDPFSGAGGVDGFAAAKILIENKAAGVMPPTSSINGPNTQILMIDLGRPAPVKGISYRVEITGDRGAFQIDGGGKIKGGFQTAAHEVNGLDDSPGTVQLRFTESYTGAFLGTATVTKDTSARVSQLQITPFQFAGGSRNATVKTTLSAPAPTGFKMDVKSSRPDVASVPSVVAFSSGATTKNFVVTTSAVTVQTGVIISARKQGSTGVWTEGYVILDPVKPLNVVPSATSAYPGEVVTWTAKLTGPAPASGFTIGFTTSDANLIAPPRQLNFLGGETEKTFTTIVGPAQAKKEVRVNLRFQNATVHTGKIMVLAPVVSGHTLSQSSVKGGTSVEATVTLDLPAPAGDLTVGLSQYGTGATIPASIVVPAGSTSATYTVVTAPTTTQKTVKIIARTGAVTRTAALTITK